MIVFLFFKGILGKLVEFCKGVYKLIIFLIILLLFKVCWIKILCRFVVREVLLVVNKVEDIWFVG